MSLLSIVIVLIVIGIALWLVNTYIPMDAKIKKIINIVVLVVVCIWLLRALGVFEYLEKVSI